MLLRNKPNSLKTAIFSRIVGALHRRRKPLKVLLRETRFCWASGLPHKPSVTSKIIIAKNFGYLLRRISYSQYYVASRPRVDPLVSNHLPHHPQDIAS